MKSEDIKELKELVEFLKENNIGEFDLERGELKIRIKFAQESGADLAGLARLVDRRVNLPRLRLRREWFPQPMQRPRPRIPPKRLPARRTMRLRCMW